MKYDVCIVGSGAGAGPVAYELARAGYKVVVLEKGAFYERKDFFKDEIAVCRRATFTPRLDKEQHVIEQFDGSKWVATPTSQSGWDFWNGSMVGGSSNLMSGYFHRLKPNDFKLKSVYGAVEGANIEDWPISYEELEPYYEKVERIVGISGSVVDHSFLEWRSSAHFPYPPLEEHPCSAWFDEACKGLKLTPIPTPRAILSRPKKERNSCEYSGFCGSYGCHSGAKGSSREALLKPALKSNNLTIITQAFVSKLIEKDHRVVAAHYRDKDKKLQSIEARIFVVAAQAIESSRLLLNSKSKNFPKGLANNSNQVGKNLIFSAGGNGSGSFYYKDLSPKKAQQLQVLGPFFNRSLQSWYELEVKNRRLKGGTIDFLFEHPNAVPKLKSALYEGELVWGEALRKKILKRFQKKVLNFEIFCDWTPHDNCFVSLDERIKDRFGLPVAKVRIGAHKRDVKLAQILAQKSEAVLEAMGAKEINSYVSELPPQNLQAGGCRFGDDARTSVLDKNCKAHELENLYVSDGSFMPTGGSVPFTWTIYANAFRVADAIKRHLKRG